VARALHQFLLTSSRMTRLVDLRQKRYTSPRRYRKYG
jgi:hypothetical protein